MPQIEIDHPNVRASVVCPLCQGPKDASLVACWACYHKHEMRYGNPDANLAIDQAEENLAWAGLLTVPVIETKGVRS